jgi:hypothetical protein
MGTAMIELATDEEFRTRLRYMIGSSAPVKDLERAIAGYFMARGLDHTEAMLLTGMYAMGGFDGAAVIVEGPR